MALSVNFHKFWDNLVDVFCLETTLLIVKHFNIFVIKNLSFY